MDVTEGFAKDLGLHAQDGGDEDDGPAVIPRISVSVPKGNGVRRARRGRT